MHRNHDFSTREIPFSQLSRPLTARETAQDGLIIETGMRPARRLTPSSQMRIAQASVRYVWPAPSSHHPYPRHPAQPQ